MATEDRWHDFAKEKPSEATCKELKAIKQGSVELGEYWVYDADDVDALLAEKDAEIRRLNDALDKERSETIKYMDELCNAKNEIERLTIDKRNAEQRADIADATAEKLKAENECLEQELESVQAMAYAESVDAGMRERRLRRLLWHAIALFCARSCEYFNGIMSHCLMGQDDLYKRCAEKKNKYLHAMYKCRAKAEQYKEAK